MKTYSIRLTFGCLMLQFSSLCAQPTIDTTQYIYALWNASQRKMISENMSVPEDRKAAFWQVYDSYCDAREFLEMEYIRIQYLRIMFDLPEKKLFVLDKELLENNYQMARVRKEYFKKFSRALSVEAADIFMQLDDDHRTWRRLNFENDLFNIQQRGFSENLLSSANY